VCALGQEIHVEWSIVSNARESAIKTVLCTVDGRKTSVSNDSHDSSACLARKALLLPHIDTHGKKMNIDRCLRLGLLARVSTGEVTASRSDSSMRIVSTTTNTLAFINVKEFIVSFNFKKASAQKVEEGFTETPAEVQSLAGSNTRRHAQQRL
jgi:hypothetical protein